MVDFLRSKNNIFYGWSEYTILFLSRQTGGGVKVIPMISRNNTKLLCKKGVYIICIDHVRLNSLIFMWYIWL